ncbi:MAG: hypothetical protein WCN27_04990, partial [Alphaproteobacteria bacterium]
FHRAFKNHGFYLITNLAQWGDFPAALLSEHQKELLGKEPNFGRLASFPQKMEILSAKAYSFMDTVKRL